MKTNDKLSNKELNAIWFRWARFHLSSMSYEKLQASNWDYCMIPLAKKYYEDKSDEAKELMKRHTAFYNTEPQTGALVVGIVTGLEEAKARGEEIADEVIISIKSTLMGPIAGIGDAIIQGVIVPILLSIAMGLSGGGSIVGPLFYIFSWGIIGPIISYMSFKSGYKSGEKAVDTFIGESSKNIREAFNILGIIVVGGLAASYVSLVTTMVIPYGDNTAPLQDIIDGNFPKLLPLLVVLLSWYLLSKKKMGTTQVLFILTGIVIIGCLIGLF